MHYTKEQLVRIAKAQKLLLLGVLCNVVVNALFIATKGVRASKPSGLPLNVLLLVLGIAAMVLIWIAVIRLPLALKTGGAWTLAVITLLLSWVPLIGLLMMLLLSGRATSTLKLAEIPVGLMGVRRDHLDQLEAEE